MCPLVCSAAPSAAPQEFSVNITNSRTVELAWIPPLEQEQNGFIEEYVINITREGDSLDQVVSIMTSIVISNLSPFTNYSFSVAAVTVGVGPFSPAVTITMPEHGKKYSVVHSVFMFLTWFNNTACVRTTDFFTQLHLVHHKTFLLS